MTAVVGAVTDVPPSSAQRHNPCTRVPPYRGGNRTVSFRGRNDRDRGGRRRKDTGLLRSLCVRIGRRTCPERRPGPFREGRHGTADGPGSTRGTHGTWEGTRSGRPDPEGRRPCARTWAGRGTRVSPPCRSGARIHAAPPRAGVGAPAPRDGRAARAHPAYPVGGTARLGEPVQATRDSRISRERCGERPHMVWSRPGSRACASPAGGRRPSGAVSAVGQEGVHASGSAESKVRASRGRTWADMLCSIMRRAASARSASMWATASGARLTSKCRMWASSAE